jgi:hypothetical protein
MTTRRSRRHRDRAAGEDTKFGFSHLFDWDRAVMVTDVEWMRQAVKFFGGVFGFLAPVGQWCVFPLAEADRASEWVLPRGCSPPVGQQGAHTWGQTTLFGGWGGGGT